VKRAVRSLKKITLSFRRLYDERFFHNSLFGLDFDDRRGAGLGLGRRSSPQQLQRIGQLSFILPQLVRLVLPAFLLQQLLPQLLQLGLLHPQLLQLQLLPTDLLPARFVLPTDHVLPADDLLRAGSDLQLHAGHDLPTGDDLPGLHRVRPPVQHELRADDDLQLLDLLDALLPADLQLPHLQHVELLPADLLLELQLLAFLLQLVQQLLPLLPLELQLQLRLQALS
jgi:hypothetical protein